MHLTTLCVLFELGVKNILFVCNKLCIYFSRELILPFFVLVLGRMKVRSVFENCFTNCSIYELVWFYMTENNGSKNVFMHSPEFIDNIFTSYTNNIIIYNFCDRNVPLANSPQLF